jgi:hypothetical protein
MYEAPAGGGSLPPGWAAAPHEEAPDIEDEEFPVAPAVGDRQNAREFMATHRNDTREALEAAASPEVAAAVAAWMKNIGPSLPSPTLPVERINLDAGTAHFMGYDVELTPDGLESIKIILAAEVCLRLENERDRVLNAVQQPRVPPASDGGRENVPEVPESPQSVDTSTTSRSDEVLGMWISDPIASLAPMFRLPGTQAGVEGEGSGTQPGVPGSDDSSLPQSGELLQRDGAESTHPAEDRRAAKRGSDKPKPRVRRRKRTAARHVPE